MAELAYQESTESGVQIFDCGQYEVVQKLVKENL